MEDEDDAAAEDGDVEGVGGVEGPVGVHCDAGGEEDCRYPALYERLLVRELIEYVSECSAAVVVVRYFKVSLVQPVAGGEISMLFPRQGFPAEHDYIVLPS